ncbi:MAG: thymidylate kinase [Ruminococcaceae bacterium]|nr:thymidylate kinase [Oscillospiraceae bacterium]
MGILIAIEGLDGCGKNTQAERLAERLCAAGKNARCISFPDYDCPSSAPVRMYLGGELGGSPDDVNAYAASSFFAVDRVISYKRDWERFYNDGGIVIANRYTTSNAPHQMSKLPPEQWDEFLAWLFDYEYRLLGMPEPNTVIMLTMPREISKRLLSERYKGDPDKEDIHERASEYMLRCAECAEYVSQRYGWQVIDCAPQGELLSVETISDMICDTLQRLGIIDSAIN